MELIKAPIIADKRDVTLNDYLEEVQKSNDVEVSEEDIEIVNKDEDAYILVDDKYEYLLEKEDDGNLKITYQGKVGKLKPRITSIEVTNTTNSITVKVNAKYADEYKFYIGTSTENYEEKEINETGEFTFTKLTQNVTYYIKVEAINDNGTATEEIQRTTGTIVTEEGAITFGNITWDGTTHKASVSISTNTEYGIKYNVNGTTEELEDIIKWNSYTQSLTGLIVGDTVYACLSDGTNIGKTYASIKITDGTNPTVPNQIETSVTKTTITATASGSTDLEGEIAGYQYSLDGKSWTETKALGTAHTFTGISTLTTKTIYARAVDGVNHISEAKTVTATTLPEEYTITYDANEGEGAPEAQTKTQATELTLSSTVPTRTGYNFLGWSTSSTATTVTYTAGGKYTTDSGTTLYAVWSAKTVKVTFMRNTSSTDTTSAIQTFTYGVKQVILY